MIKYLGQSDTFTLIPKSDILLFCQDVDRSDEKFGKPYSRLLDSIHEDLASRGFRCNQVVIPHKSKLIGDKAWAKPYSANRSFFAAYLIDGFYNLIGKLLGIGRRVDETCRGNVYSKIFDLASPKIIFTIGANKHLCRAAKSKKIKVIEVLHGIGYDSVKWGWGDLDFSELPDYILSLDKVSTKSFRKLETKGVIVTEIPHPWYKRFLNIRKNDQLDPNWLNNSIQNGAYKKSILISLVWGYDGDHGADKHFKNVLENGLIPKELIDAIKETQDEIFWFIRRHPVQIRNSAYEHQKKFLNQLTNNFKNTDWEKSSETTLLSLIMKCDGHITMSSMSSYDAAILGRKSLVMCPSLQKGQINELWFEDLVAEKYCQKIIPDKTKIIKWVQEVSKIKPYQISTAEEKDWEKFLDKMDLNERIRSL